MTLSTSDSSDTEPKVMECPLSQIKIVTCPVTTCAYHTCHKTGNCLANLGLLEDLEFHVDEIAEAKGITPDEYRILSSKGQKNIQRIMVINDFLNWCAEKHWSTYPRIEGYHDPELVAYVNRELVPLSPFNIKMLAWNMGRICVAVTPKWWEQYCDQKEIDFVSVSLSLGIPRKLVSEIQDQFRLAHKRALSTATATTGEK